MVEALEQAIIANLRAGSGLPVRVEPDLPSGPQSGVDGDTPQVALAGGNSRWLRVWRNVPCLVASRRQSRMPGFAQAAGQSAQEGWPLAVRRSGGTTVVHRPGMLNISLIGLNMANGHPGTRPDYLTLLDVIARALAPLGIEAGHGAVAGAHCDGDYNLVSQGRKLAGTAGFVSRLNGMNLRVFHATLSIGGALDADLAAITRFESALGEHPRYDRQAHVTVAEILASQSHPATGAMPQQVAHTGERR